jgi:hypothetical protein
MAKSATERVMPSSCNVFADMGYRMPLNLIRRPVLEPRSTASWNGVGSRRPKSRRRLKSISPRSLSSYITSWEASLWRG